MEEELAEFLIAEYLLEIIALDPAGRARHPRSLVALPILVRQSPVVVLNVVQLLGTRRDLQRNKLVQSPTDYCCSHLGQLGLSVLHRNYVGKFGLYHIEELLENFGLVLCAHVNEASWVIVL